MQQRTAFSYHTPTSSPQGSPKLGSIVSPLSSPQLRPGNHKRTDSKYFKAAIQNAHRKRQRRQVTLLVLFLSAVAAILLLVPYGLFDDGNTELLQLPVSAMPLSEDDDDLLSNHPISHHRPVQFKSDRNNKQITPPTLAIGTLLMNVTSHGSGVSDWTYPSLLRSSFSKWQWAVFVAKRKDRSHKKAVSMLKKWGKSDNRIRLVEVAIEDNTDGMNKLLAYLSHSSAPYGVFAPAFTLFEPTILEKSIWSLHSVPTWHIVDHFHVKYNQASGLGRIFKKGLHSGRANLDSALIAHASVFRLNATSTCQFADFADFDVSQWLFWLCMADSDHWGGTLPEVGSWQLTPSAGENKVSQQLAKTFYPRLEHYDFPKNAPARSTHLETISWQNPYPPKLVSVSRKRIMIIQGWLLVGGSELGLLKVVEHFARQGYAITMVLTRFRYPEGVALRPEVAQYTNDIHFLPALLRLNDFPTYIKWLIDTRGIPVVIMSNSQLIYQILPALAESTPGVKYVDYLHNEGYDGWKNFGFPTYSLISQRYIARTLTCSAYLRQWMINHGGPAERIGVAKLGIAMAGFPIGNDVRRIELKSSMFDLQPSDVTVTWLARFETQKRPILFPEAFAKAKQLAADMCPDKNLVGLMMGDGLLKSSVQQVIQHYNLSDDIRMLGTVSHPEVVLQASDIFFLPTSMEGLSLALAEAMATGLPVLTSFVGALPEQFLSKHGEQTGVLIQLSGNETEEVERYAEELAKLVCYDQFRTELGQAAARHVRESFDTMPVMVTMPAFEEQLQLSLQAKPASIQDTPNPVAYYGLEGMLMEDYRFVDMSSAQHEMAANLDTEVGLPSLMKTCLSDVGQAQKDPMFMRWATSIVNPVYCDNITVPNSDWLLKSAVHQCESWCIWDLRTFKEQGWRWNGDCFRYFKRGDVWHGSCKAWFHERPAVTLLETVKHG